MKETYWGYWLVLLGVFIIGVMLLVNNITTTNTQDYYNVKEVTQASMVDAIDFSYYRLYGNLKMSEHKFVENFARRFSENLNLANTYDIDFYDIYEVPPKVSVKVSTRSNAFNIGNSSSNAYDVDTTLSAILELGVSNDGDGGNNKKKTGACYYRISDALWKLFKGEEVGGYTYDSFMTKFEGAGNNSLRSKYDQYRNITDKDTFMTKFGELLKSDYKGLDLVMKKFIENNWITVIRD